MDLKLEFRPIRDWCINISEEMPEVFCISRPYIEQFLLAEVCHGANDKIDKIKKGFAWGIIFSDHHHGHGSPRRSQIKVEDRKVLKEKLREASKFILKAGLRFRREGKGLVIADGHSAYYFNSKGAELLERFKEQVEICRTREICAVLNISKHEFEGFLKKLLIFSLVKCIQ